jgi:hypothetical protein
MESFGIYLYNDSPGVLEKGGYGFGRHVVGRILLLSPYLTAADLFYRAGDRKPESWLWSLTVVAVVAVVLYLAEHWLIGLVRRWKEDGSFAASVLFPLVVLIDIVLKLWALFAWTSEKLHSFREAPALLFFGALLLIFIFIVRLSNGRR